MRYFYSPGREAFFLDVGPVAIPQDAIELTAEEYAGLLDRQAQGDIIKPDTDGRPLAVDRTTDTGELLASLRARRDALLQASDWTQVPDSPLSEAARAEWVAYRQSLRDLPETVTDPAAIEWPVPPT